VYRQRHNATFVPGFLDQLLRIRPYVSEFVVRSTGIRSSRLRLYPEQLLRIPLVQPPLKEQERILQKVQMETAVLEHSMQRAQREIELIREYRTRLISDVVTGRLDVRGVEVPETDLKEVSEAINAEMAVDLETIDEEEPAAVEEGEDAGD
jgi:type I restriction enzyme S subunit